jgi:hypothetical protein
MSRKLVTSAVILGIVILLAYFGYYLYRTYSLPPIVPLPPPLASVEFPSEQTQYPVDWPDELKFPSGFMLVDSSSGTLPESTAQGWAAKFRYQGKPSEATKLISSFMEEKRWTIVENNKLDSGGFSLLIQREQGNGIIVIDSDPSDAAQTLIIATIFP